MYLVLHMLKLFSFHYSSYYECCEKILHKEIRSITHITKHLISQSMLLLSCHMFGTIGLQVIQYIMKQSFGKISLISSYSKPLPVSYVNSWCYTSATVAIVLSD
jgi:hypothetical protein